MKQSSSVWHPDPSQLPYPAVAKSPADVPPFVVGKWLAEEKCDGALAHWAECEAMGLPFIVVTYHRGFNCIPRAAVRLHMATTPLREFGGDFPKPILDLLYRLNGFRWLTLGPWGLFVHRINEEDAEALALALSDVCRRLVASNGTEHSSH